MNQKDACGSGIPTKAGTNKPGSPSENPDSTLSNHPSLSSASCTVESSSNTWPYCVHQQPQGTCMEPLDNEYCDKKMLFLFNTFLDQAKRRPDVVKDALECKSCTLQPRRNSTVLYESENHCSTQEPLCLVRSFSVPVLPRNGDNHNNSTEAGRSSTSIQNWHCKNVTPGRDLGTSYNPRSSPCSVFADCTTSCMSKNSADNVTFDIANKSEDLTLDDINLLFDRFEDGDDDVELDVTKEDDTECQKSQVPQRIDEKDSTNEVKSDSTIYNADSSKEDSAGFRRAWTSSSFFSTSQLSRPSPRSSTTLSLRYVEIRHDDVLCRRGGQSIHHPGNIKMRALVRERLPLYMKSTRAEKTKISKDIIRIIASRGGRFLKKMEAMSHYKEKNGNRCGKQNQGTDGDNDANGGLIFKNDNDAAEVQEGIYCRRHGASYRGKDRNKVERYQQLDTRKTLAKVAQRFREELNSQRLASWCGRNPSTATHVELQSFAS